MGPCTDVCGLDWGIALTDLIFMITRRNSWGTVHYWHWLQSLVSNRMSTSVLKVKDKFHFLKLGERQYSNGGAFNVPLILVNVSQI